MPQLCHSVFFTLRDRGEAAKKALVEGCRKHLSGHPGTLAFAVGTCAAYDRQVNDRDHDVALHIIFDSHESHDAYQQAPRHADFIAEHATTWARVRVFDADLAALET
ncbi:MAG: Dabb family protein [Planctomycetaceae bacterium]